MLRTTFENSPDSEIPHQSFLKNLKKPIQLVAGIMLALSYS